MDVDPSDFPLPPYYETIGIEILEVEPGHAVGRLDLRLDFLAPGTDDLTATATVTCDGAGVGTVDVDVETVDDLVAVARDAFKTGGGEGASARDAPDR